MCPAGGVYRLRQRISLRYALFRILQRALDFPADVQANGTAEPKECHCESMPELEAAVAEILRSPATRRGSPGFAR